MSQINTKEAEKSPEYFMKAAIEEAKKAEQMGEVPIGAVVVLNNQIIGRGHNRRELTQVATTHAEMYAIEEANRYLGNWRLTDCDLYVTLEPCPMCSGAIILSRLRRVYYGASDYKAGTAGTLMNLLTDTRFNHQATVIPGVCEEACQQLLSHFFKKLREAKKEKKRLLKAINESEHFNQMTD
ncbi:tRNA adenosine(34) deaminase TadA [Atopobacter phocae]|uniref:tRNA adenosine(34) deaminase TadA n=1 Tax=Atopobacter phocae TaxID=136492 RepID=UPI000472D2A7|nr:tRNA adenosine(34) deaminase TadA [Atopobacter phocae]